MTHGFYVYLHCKPDGTPFYVGKGHGKRARKFSSGRNRHHKSVVQKYGADQIGVFIFPCESEEEALQDERRHIADLRAAGYVLANVTDGGDGVSGLRHTTTSKEKMAIAKLGKPLSEAHRLALKEASRTMSHSYKVGRRASDETRARMSKAQAGRKKPPITQSHRDSLSRAHLGQVAWNKGLPSPNRGIPRPPEVRAKIAAANAARAGRSLSAEHKQKLAAARTGKSLSPEHRAKVSKGLRAFNEQRKRALTAQGDSHGE